MFKFGSIVKNANNVLLVIGKGKVDVGYPTFSGVVIMSQKKDEEQPWPLGMYSDTWSTRAFKKIDIKLSGLVKKAFKRTD